MDFALTPEQETFGKEFSEYLKTAMTPELTAEMEEMGRETDWRAEYIGDWGHMRGQMLIRYTPEATDGGGA